MHRHGATTWPINWRQYRYHLPVREGAIIKVLAYYYIAAAQGSLCALEACSWPVERDVTICALFSEKL